MKICGTRFLFARFIVPPQPVVYVFPTTTEHLNAVEYLVPTKSVQQTKTVLSASGRDATLVNETHIYADNIAKSIS